MTKEYESSNYRSNSTEEMSRANYGGRSKQAKQRKASAQAGSNNLNKYRF